MTAKYTKGSGRASSTSAAVRRSKDVRSEPSDKGKLLRSMKEKAIEEARCEEERCEEARRQKLREGKISPPVGTTEAGVKSDEGKLENDDACFISPKSKDEADAIEAALEMTRLSIT